MKQNKKIYIFILSVVLLLICIFAMSSCTKPLKLATPANVLLTDADILTWDAVEGAAGYFVEIDGREYNTETNSFDVFEMFLTTTTFEVSVSAYTYDEEYSDSDISEIYSMTVEVCERKGVLGYIPINDGTEYACAIGDVTKVKGKFVIPAEFNGLPVTEIYTGAFKDCVFLKSVYMPDSITTLKVESFMNCTSLERIRLSSNLTDLSKDTFNNCVSLKSITIPKKCRDINQENFNNCPALEEILVEEGNDTFKVDGNCLIKPSSNTLLNTLYLGCATSVIPDYVTRIRYNAFWGKGIVGISVPASVTQIDANAFRECKYLQYVNLENTKITQIDVFTFMDCNRLKTVVLPDTLETIRSLAFDSSGITSLHLPKNVREIQPAIIANCEDLATLTVAQDNVAFKSEGNCVIDKSSNELVLGCQTSVIPDYVESIGGRAFLGCTFETFVIPGTVKTIGWKAFAECKNLREIYISNGVETIESEAFALCMSLQAITLPESVVRIGGSLHTSLFWPANVAMVIEMKLNNYGCTVDYDIHGNNEIPYVVSMPNPFYNVGHFIPRPADVDFHITSPVRLGYTFAGWATEEGGPVVHAPHGFSGERSTSVGADTRGGNIQMVEGLSGCFSTDLFKNLSQRHELVQQDIVLYAVWI